MQALFDSVGVTRKMDSITNTFRTNRLCIVDRVRLDGDGWVEIAGPRDTIAEQAAHVFADGRFKIDEVARLPCASVRVRIAPSDSAPTVRPD